MATLALSVAGAAIGSTLLPAGISVLGATISGAVIGSQIGALAGAYVDQALFASSGQSRTVNGPRLSDLKVTASTEGAADTAEDITVRSGSIAIAMASYLLA